MATEPEAVTAALLSAGVVTKTRNAAVAPLPAGAPEYLYASALQPTVVEYTTITVSYTTGNAPWANEVTFAPTAILLDAKVVVATSFDAGSTNTLTFGAGANNVFHPSLITFANVADLHPAGFGAGQPGTPVTGYDSGGNDTPQFLPVLLANVVVFVGYGYTGAPPTQGSATVVLSYIQTA